MTEKQKAYIAVAIVCVVWGTTYLANKIAVSAYPALQFAFIRVMIASVLIFAFFTLTGRGIRLPWKDLKHQMVLGFFLITLGLGVGTASLKYLDSGIAALLATLTPMIIVVFNMFMKLENPTTWLGWLGMLIAVGGCIILLSGDVNFYSSRNGLLGLLLFSTCMIAWSFGSLYSKKPINQSRPMLNAAYQMFFGGLLMIPLGLIFEDWKMEWFDATRAWAMVYLVFLGSIVTYGAFVYALTQLPASVVTINAYVNPLIAIYVGWLILGERLDVNIVASTVLILGGIYLISVDHRKSRIKS